MCNLYLQKFKALPLIEVWPSHASFRPDIVPAPRDNKNDTERFYAAPDRRIEWKDIRKGAHLQYSWDTCTNVNQALGAKEGPDAGERRHIIKVRSGRPHSQSRRCKTLEKETTLLHTINWTETKRHIGANHPPCGREDALHFEGPSWIFWVHRNAFRQSSVSLWVCHETTDTYLSTTQRKVQRKLTYS